MIFLLFVATMIEVKNDGLALNQLFVEHSGTSSEEKRPYWQIMFSFTLPMKEPLMLIK